jgi:outer membrane murein-binding lipoprotein Lpp
MTSLDQSVENLRTLCELLRATNPLVESGGTALSKVAHTLADGEQHLSTDLDHLATEVDSIQKQAESTGADAAKALTELDHAADEARTEALGKIETDAPNIQAHWAEALSEKGTSLDTAFGELKSNGWDPLAAALIDEEEEFAKWTDSADETLKGLVHAVEEVTTGVHKEMETAVSKAKELEDSDPLKEDHWSGTQDDAKTIVEVTIPDFGHLVDSSANELRGVYEQVMTAIDEGSHHVRSQLDLTTEGVVTAIIEHAEPMNQGAEAANDQLRNAQARYELSAVHGEAAEKEGARMLELAGHVVEAQAQLAKVREVLEAIGQ